MSDNVFNNQQPRKHPFICYSDASGNPVTQQVQSVAVTDASGNPVTGILANILCFWYVFDQ